MVTFKGLHWHQKLFALIALLMVGWSIYIIQNNTYMEYKDVHVTFVDKWSGERCGKHGCRGELRGLFRTDDGTYFERNISLYMYSQMHLGEQFDLSLRQFDIEQTTWDNAVWLFLPSVVWSVTFGLWLWAIVMMILGIVERRNARAAKDKAGKYNGY